MYEYSTVTLNPLKPVGTVNESSIVKHFRRPVDDLLRDSGHLSRGGALTKRNAGVGNTMAKNTESEVDSYFIIEATYVLRYTR